MEKRVAIAFLPGAAGERALLSRLTAGEDEAFRECYELHAASLMRILVRLVRNRAVAEEILQETFIAAFKSVGSFRGETRLSTWLTGIALRRGFNAIRGESRRMKNTPPSPESGPSPEPWLADRDLTRKVLAVLDEMEPEKRAALLLQAEGYTAAEIAQMSDEPRGTILSRLARARAELAQRAAAAGLSDPSALLEGEGR
ncbi:MAG TPA: sigma-70 family RNA polymerase sigma factor [Myxococcales bacterium]